MMIFGDEYSYKRAPKGLRLFMDGVEKAVIEEDNDSEFVDMMDHRPFDPKYINGAANIPLASSFKLVWDLGQEISERVGRPVGLRRVTIGYAHEGLNK